GRPQGALSRRGADDRRQARAAHAGHREARSRGNDAGAERVRGDREGCRAASRGGRPGKNRLDVHQQCEVVPTPAKQLTRRIRDKVPYSQGDRMMLNAGSGWMVEGSPQRVLRDYNQLVEAYNRGASI